MGEAKSRAEQRAKARLERRIPETLSNLAGGEDMLRQMSIDAIHADPVLMDHVVLVEAVMDHLDYHAVLDSTGNLDLETIQMLGARMFNSLASAYGQMLRGYYQISATILRDVMEVTFLLRMFDHDRTQITKWREADDRALKKDFKPIAVRMFLENYDSWTGGNRRAEMYGLLCEYAAHASWKGFTLMGPTGGGKRTIGPFFDVSLTKAVLEEMSQLVAQAGSNYAVFFGYVDSIPALETELRRMEVTADWAARYQGRKAPSDEFRDLRRMLAAEKKRQSEAS